MPQVRGDELGQLLPRCIGAGQGGEHLVRRVAEEVLLHRQRRLVIVVDRDPLAGLDAVQPEAMTELPRHGRDHQRIGGRHARTSPRAAARGLVEGRERVVVVDPGAHVGTRHLGCMRMPPSTRMTSAFR